MIAENYRGFRGSRLLDILTAAADKDQARGLVVIIDVIKKVTDPMSKRLSAAFGKGARQFVLRGGTIIALAHVNKHRTADDKPVFGGTSDLLDDFDAGYLMYQVSVDAVAQTKTITLENIKSRGDVARHASYRYSTAAGQSYRELLDSITAVDQSEASVAQRSEQMHTDADLIKIARESISAGIDTRMVLAAAIAQKSGCSKRKAFQLLDRHTGEDPQRHRWAFYVKARGAKTYRLLSPAVDDPEADA
jgi:hypothetical protein